MCLSLTYITSAESIRILTASDKAYEGFGVSKSQTLCRFICSVRPDNTANGCFLLPLCIGKGSITKQMVCY